MRLLSLMLVLFVTMIHGCSRGPDDGRADMPTVVMPVLEIDPIDMPEMPQWFSNGELTINFQPSGHYRTYKGLNRHADAVEKGRWVRLNYVSVSLEPYAVGRAAQPTRATLFRADDDAKTLMLRFPPTREGKAVAPMRALAGPPRVIHDDLFGMWEGNNATLELNRDMRFVYKPGDAPDTPASIAGFIGSWSVDGQQLVLHPDVPAIAPISFDVTGGDGEVLLVSSAGELRRP